MGRPSACDICNCCLSMTNPVIPTAANVKTIRTAGGNLFRLSLDNLGDPLQWTRIATSNRLLDPFPPSDTQTLAIPRVNMAVDNSGVLHPNVGGTGPVGI